MLKKKLPRRKGKWAEKKFKGAKIMCKAKIDRISTSVVGGMGCETPFIVFDTPWGKYRWQSDKVDSRKYAEGDVGDLNAFVRPDGRHLYRVSFDTEG